MDGSQESSDNIGNLLPLLPQGVVSTADNSTSSKKYSLLSMLVNQVKSSIETTPINNTDLVTAVSFTPGSIPSDCPNSNGSMNLTANSSTTGANISINFDDYCTVLGSVSVTTNGSLSATVMGTGFDTGTPVMSSMNMTIPLITISTVDSNNISYTDSFAGTMSATFSNGELASMSVSLNFAENGVVFRMEGLSYTGSGANITISGTIYHPMYGYVNFESDPTDPFDDSTGQLCDGTLIITSDDGSTVSITADATCSTYTYSGTDVNDVAFDDTYTTP